MPMETKYRGLYHILILSSTEPADTADMIEQAKICGEFAPTRVVAFVLFTQKPQRQYEGRVYIERAGYASKTQLGLFLLVNHLRRLLTPASKITNVFVTQSRLRSIISVLRGWLAAGVLYKHSRAFSIFPRLIICNDIFALIAALRLKKIFNCHIVYSGIKTWPETREKDQNGPARLKLFWERRLVQQATGVIAPSPQIGQHIERLYGVTAVFSAPDSDRPRAYEKVIQTYLNRESTVING